MSRAPITRQRSEWLDVTRHDAFTPALDMARAAGSRDLACFIRRVGDGILRAIRALEPEGLHLSVSWAPNSERQAPRYPTWDELADARDMLLPAELGFVMHLPPASDYVAVHATTFHLHQHPPSS